MSINRHEMVLEAWENFRRARAVWRDTTFRNVREKRQRSWQNSGLRLCAGWFLTSLLLGLSALGVTQAHEADSRVFIAGQLLVATPEMKDPRFIETVIYMVKHDAEGALGLVINRPAAKGPIRDLLKGFGLDNPAVKGEIVIHYGGPVSRRQGFMLHCDDVVMEKSIKVKDGIAMTSDVGLIEAVGQGKGPSRFLLALGYAGWSPGQLEAELKANSWFVVPGDKAFIFGRDAAMQWRQAMDKRQIPL